MRWVKNEQFRYLSPEIRRSAIFQLDRMTGSGLISHSKGLTLKYPMLLSKDET